MKGFFFFLLTAASISSVAQQEGAATQGRLKGTWIPVKEEIGGAQLPDSAFSNQKLIMQDTSYLFIAESRDEGAAFASNGHIDIFGRKGPNEGKHFTAIYKFDGDELIICYNLTGQGYPEHFDTKEKPTYFLARFRRQAGP